MTDLVIALILGVMAGGAIGVVLGRQSTRLRCLFCPVRRSARPKPARLGDWRGITHEELVEAMRQRIAEDEQ